VLCLYCADKLVDDSELGTPDGSKAGGIQLKHWKKLPSHFDDDAQPFVRGTLSRLYPKVLFCSGECGNGLPNL